MSFFSRKRKHSAPAITWSAYPPLRRSLSPFLRSHHALSTTATAAGELFLFGGYAYGSQRNDLYVFSTRDFSTTLLQTSVETPSPRCGYGAALTSAHFLIWGGLTKDRQNQVPDDSLYLLNLGMSIF